MTYVVFCIVAVIIFLGAFAYKIEHVHQKERDVWKQERKELMIVSKRHPLRNTSRGSEDGESAKGRKACTNIPFRIGA